MQRRVLWIVSALGIAFTAGCGSKECSSSDQCAQSQVCDPATRLCVDETSIPLVVQSVELPDAMINLRYKYALAANGGARPYTWSLKNVPPQLAWLTIDAATGELSGTPTVTAPPSTFDVEATDANGATDTETFQLVIRVCNNDEIRACHVVANNACQAGEQTCKNEVLSECSLKGPSTTPDACGASCEPCGPTADSCVEGQCACGASSPCSGTDAACCGGACVGTSSDPDNCGGCGVVCDPNRTNVSRSCNQGICEYSCKAGWGRCGADADAPGCNTDLLNDINNCGACGNACTATDGAAGVACVQGQCQVTSCLAGRDNCDKKYANGCEVDVTSDVNNCGTCAQTCDAVANGSPVCNGGQCKPNCNSGFADCDGIFGTGCEIDTTKDTNHCGACGDVCSVPANTSTVACSASTCQLGPCKAGYENCDHNYDTGCEINLTNDINNCGACNNKCTRPNSTVTNFGCSNSGCRILACQPNLGDCNHNFADGCEASLVSSSNCGGCGYRCESGEICKSIQGVVDCWPM